MLTQEQKEFYRENGYLALEGILSPAELKVLHEIIDELVEKAQSLETPNSLCDFEPVKGPDGRKIIRRIFNPFEQAKCFEEIARHQNVLDAVEDVIGPNIQIHHSKLNMKPARAGSPVKWHQDLPFFPHTNTDLVACLIHLNDSTLENGCLRVVPGSHKLGPLDHRRDGRFIGMVTDDLKKADMDKAVNLPLKAGGMVLLHCLTLHSSAPNRSEATRRMLIYEYRAADSMQLYGTPNNYMGRLLRGIDPKIIRSQEITYILPDYPLGTNIYDLQVEYDG